MSSFFVVLNPAAGHGKALRLAPVIEAYLKNRAASFTIYRTRSSGDAVKVVAKAELSKDTVVVSAGGDGTCNEVVNGLLARPDAASVKRTLGLLPIGRGNDFAYSAAVNTDIQKALETLCALKTADMDVGWVKGGFFTDARYFVNGVGIGFDTKVGFEAAKMRHVHSGVAYALGAIKTLAKFEGGPLAEITRDGQTVTGRSLLISVMNGRRMGGIFFMAPHAKLDDGNLDLCTVDQVATRRRLLKLVISYTAGAQERYREVAMTRAKTIRLRALDGGFAAHADGETVCYDGKELELGLVPRALRLIGDWP